MRLLSGWRSGTAHVLDEDDPRARLRRMGLRLNALVVRLMGTDLLSVRIDLDPPTGRGSRPSGSGSSSRPE
jgi:hypothetical protein